MRDYWSFGWLMFGLMGVCALLYFAVFACEYCYCVVFIQEIFMRSVSAAWTAS